MSARTRSDNNGDCFALLKHLFYLLHHFFHAGDYMNQHVLREPIEVLEFLLRRFKITVMLFRIKLIKMTNCIETSMIFSCIVKTTSWNTVISIPGLYFSREHSIYHLEECLLRPKTQHFGRGHAECRK
jgi:hypothetical protein